MKNIIYLLLMLCIVSCNNKTGESTVVDEISAQERFLNAFQMVDIESGPLHSYNTEGEIEEPLADSIVEAALPESLLVEIGFQTGDTKYQAMLQFSLDENHTACILNVNESWYRQQSLLVYDHSEKEFEKVTNLSQFYGGDGGQVVTESWLYRDSDENFLYQKESSHAMIMETTTGEPEKFLSENNSLQKWNGNSFESTEMLDSIALSKRFEFSWKW